MYMTQCFNRKKKKNETKPIQRSQTAKARHRTSRIQYIFCVFDSFKLGIIQMFSSLASRYTSEFTETRQKQNQKLGSMRFHLLLIFIHIFHYFVVDYSCQKSIAQPPLCYANLYYPNRLITHALPGCQPIDCYLCGNRTKNLRIGLRFHQSATMQWIFYETKTVTVLSVFCLIRRTNNLCDTVSTPTAATQRSTLGFFFNRCEHCCRIAQHCTLL